MNDLNKDSSKQLLIVYCKYESMEGNEMQEERGKTISNKQYSTC